MTYLCSIVRQASKLRSVWRREKILEIREHMFKILKSVSLDYFEKNGVFVQIGKSGCEFTC